jgi:hypothetical protein
MLFRLANGELLYKHKTAKSRGAPELLWFIEHIDVAPAVTAEKEEIQLHMRALGYYQQIYDKDVELCLLNRRETHTPLEGIQLIRVAADTLKITPRRAASEDLKERFTRLIQPIYRKYPPPPQNEGSALQKKISLLKGMIGKKTRKSTASRGTKKNALERRLSLLTRRLRKQETLRP